MTLFFFLRLIGDLSLFYAVANAFLCMTSCDVTFVPLIVLPLCGALAYFTAQKKEALRFLPILLMPLALIGVEDLVTALIILASAIYVAVCVVRKIFVIDYDDRLSFLSLAVKALIASVFPIFLFIWDFEKLPRFVPFVLTLAISTLLLTQALRHDPKVFSQRRFRTASLLVTAGLLLIILIISSPEFLRLVAMIPGLIYEWIIAPIILVFSYVVGGLVYLISRPLSGLFASRPDTKLKTFEFQDGFMELIFSFVNTPTTSILDVVKPIVTIAIVIAVLVFFSKLLKRGYHRFRYNSIKETRSTITEKRSFQEEAPLDLFPPADPRKAVRYYYRQFLKICRRHGYVLEKSDNSAIVESGAKYIFRPENFSILSHLRQIYIKARYSEHHVTDQDVEQIKKDYEALKQESGELDSRM